MKVLVTGGAGFIGCQLVRQLVARGDRVSVIDNLVNGKRENLSGCDVELIEADIRDQSQMQTALAGVEIIYHLACLGVRHSIHSPLENHEVNAAATLQLLIAAQKAGVPRFVHVSSSEVYGRTQHVPMREDHPTFPTTIYGASKLAGESYARAFHQTYGYPTVIVRPFNSFGPRCHHEGDSGEVIPKFMLRCLADKPMVIFGDGRQTRDFTFVSDTARGILLAGSFDAAIGQTINLGSGAEISIHDLAEKIAAVVGKTSAKINRIEARPGDVPRLCADSSLAKRLLDFVPGLSFEQGLAALRDWYLKSGKSAQELLKDERVRNWEKEGEKS